MSAALIGGVSLLCFFLAYRFYGKFIERRIFSTSHDAKTPSVELEDGIDYVPTRASILFGHHFSSIAGAAPIVGPAIAVIWGWLPAVVWILVGSIFIGGVHDMGSLIVSARHKGKSIAEVAKSVISPRTRILFMFIIFFALLVVMAVFALVIALLFISFPAAVLPILMQTPVAIALGYLIYRKRQTHLFTLTLAMVCLLYFFMWLGTIVPIKVPPIFFSSEILTWVVILMAYVYTASTLPVWVLLQPRDYINSYLLLLTLGSLYLGLFVAHPTITAPAIVASPPGAPPILPFLFITIACGAISGFHALVSSGTTVKQMSLETDSRPIAYGGMLAEGALAIVAALACTAGFASRASWGQHYASWSAASGFMIKITAFVNGAGGFLEALGIPASIATTIVSVTIIAFAATSLDTATRLQRYIIAELASSVRVPALQRRHPATIIAVGSAFGLTLINGGKGGMILWPLFGTINQLMAGLTFLVLTIYLLSKNKPVLYTAVPMGFLMIFTTAALVHDLRGFAAKQNWLLFGIGVAVALLELWFIVEGALIIKKSRSVSA